MQQYVLQRLNETFKLQNQWSQIISGLFGVKCNLHELPMIYDVIEHTVPIELWHNFRIVTDRLTQNCALIVEQWKCLEQLAEAYRSNQLFDSGGTLFRELSVAYSKLCCVMKFEGSTSQGLKFTSEETCFPEELNVHDNLIPFSRISEFCEYICTPFTQ